MRGWPKSGQGNLRVYGWPRARFSVDSMLPWQAARFRVFHWRDGQWQEVSHVVEFDTHEGWLIRHVTEDGEVLLNEAGDDVLQERIEGSFVVDDAGSFWKEFCGAVNWVLMESRFGRTILPGGLTPYQRSLTSGAKRMANPNDPVLDQQMKDIGAQIDDLKQQITDAEARNDDTTVLKQQLAELEGQMQDIQVQRKDARAVNRADDKAERDAAKDARQAAPAARKQ